MIRAEIGLENKQIINETYSFRCFLILYFIFLDVLSKIKTTTHVKVRTIHTRAVIRRSEMEKLQVICTIEGLQQVNLR